MRPSRRRARCAWPRWAACARAWRTRLQKGVLDGGNDEPLIAADRLTVAGFPRQQGYATAAVGKWHVGLTFRDQAGEAVHSGKLEDVKRVDFSRRIEGGPVDHGFERFFGTACCQVRWQVPPMTTRSADMWTV